MMKKESVSMLNVDGLEKSLKMKMSNANNAKLSPAARLVYLNGLVSLSKAEALVASGYRLKKNSVYISPEGGMLKLGG